MTRYTTSDNILLFVLAILICAFPLESMLSNQGCKVDKDVYVCSDIPDGIPWNITSVLVTAFRGDTLKDEFSNRTWGHATKLELRGQNVGVIFNWAFETLIDLTELILHLPNAYAFHEMAFSGLTKLVKLDVLDTVFLESYSFTAIEDKSLSALEEFTLNPGSVNYRPTLILSTKMAKTIMTNQLVSLNISRTLIGTTFTTVLIIAASNIEIFNISGSAVMFYTSFDDYNDLLLNHLDTYQPVLNTLDISETSYSTGPILDRDNDVTAYNRVSIAEITFHRYFTLTEYVFADRIFHFDVWMDVSYNYSGLPVFMKTMSFRGNRIHNISGNLVFDANNTIQSLDVSDNKLAYISPGAISSMIHLTWLNVSTNRLFQMEIGAFRQLLRPLKELIMVDLSHNGLSDIPFDMFDDNTHLGVLTLSLNNLTTLMFNLMKLVNLKTLDLRGNRIRVIDGTAFSRLRHYALFMQSSPDGFILNLNQNPLTCDCKCVPFIEWLSYFSDIRRSRNDYFCNFNGKSIHIDQSAVNTSKYLCIKEMVIIVSTTMSALVILIILIITWGVLRRHRKRKRMSREYIFTKEFQDRTMTEEFVAFVAYASIEETIVSQLITRLNETFKEKLMVQREAVATGYDFKPGFQITEETYRLIKLSHVFLAVVSNPFCRSEYCIAELHEACNQKKPVILVFVGEVEEKDMSPYLRDVFRRVVRAKMEVGTNGQIELVPPIEALCESVISVAIASIHQSSEV